MQFKDTGDFRKVPFKSGYDRIYLYKSIFRLVGDKVDIGKLRGKLLKRKIGIIGEDNEYNKFSILIPLIRKEDDYYILFELRSKKLKSQPGEISFPGGKIERNEDSLNAAIRETCEELITTEDNIEIIGSMDILVTQHSKIIYSYVGVIKDEHKIQPSKDEVDHVFLVPLKFFIEQEPIVKSIKILSEPDEDFPYVEGVDAKKYKWDIGKSNVYFYNYNGYIIWGLTAKILFYFVKILKG